MAPIEIVECPQLTVLQQFLHEELPRERAMFIDSHITRCAGCQEILDELVYREAGVTLDQLLRRRAGEALRQADSPLPGVPKAEPDSTTPAEGPPRGASEGPIPASIAGYRVVSELGRGSYGVVYHARDDRLDRPVAIKIPHKNVVQATGGVDTYLKEAKALARLDHPNIVRIYESKSDGENCCYIVSQFIAGRTLADRLEAGRFAPLEAARLILLVADALQHAHEQGIFHRDIKPANILLDATEKPYLADFGLALKDEEIGRGPRFLGTPAYMSPEQARGEGHRVDGRTDIYSLGVVFYKMLTGKRPFPANSIRELLELVISVDAPSAKQKNRDIPAELDRICAKAMARRLSARYRSASDLADDLTAWLEAQPSSSASHRQLETPYAMAHSDLSSSGEDVESGRRIGGFKLRTRRGQGGMGIVYRAWQPSEDREIAVKCLRFEDAAARTRFLTEIRALGQVEHPNLARIYLSGMDQGRLFYAMELIEGVDLADLLRILASSRFESLDDDRWKEMVRQAADDTRAGERPLDDQSEDISDDAADAAEGQSSSADYLEARHSGLHKSTLYVRRMASIVRDIALATQALHDKAIVHRDIKPRNILLAQDGQRAVLMDLGIAKFAKDDDGGVTRTREFVGSLRYASPEQVLDSGQVNHLSDIYSLGATLWELLTLRPIYGIGPKVSDPQAMLRIEVEEPRPVRKFNRAAPADLQAIVQKCLEKNPARRYPTAAAVAVDLDRFLLGEPVGARPVRAVARFARRCRRRPVVPGLVLAMALMVMALFAALLPWPGRDDNTIRVGIKPWIGFSPLVVAEKLKLCEGVDLKLVPVRNSTDVRQKILARKLDAAPYLIDTHALARASRTPAAIVLQLDMSMSADAVIARKGINSLCDLRGKTIAYMHHEAPHFLLLSLCDKFNVGTEEFKHETVETAQEAVDLFVAGKADAVVTYDPFMRQALDVPGAHPVATAADDPGAIIDILTVREDYLRTDRPKVKTLITAWFKALDLLQRGDPAAIRIACQFLGQDGVAISPREYEDMVKGMKYGSMEQNLAFFRIDAKNCNEFRNRFNAAQRRWHTHHQLGHKTDPRDGDASDVFLEMYGP